jgi:hypothetical protein
MIDTDWWTDGNYIKTSELDFDVTDGQRGDTQEISVTVCIVKRKYTRA